MQAKSKTFADRFAAWSHHLVGSGKYGDLMRLLAGGKTVANQIEYMKTYGSAHPVITSNLKNDSDSNADKVGELEVVEFSISGGGNSEDIQGDTCYENVSNDGNGDNNDKTSCLAKQNSTQSS
jgi:hypothetical protein